MKKLFQKLLGKLIKKAVKKSVDAAVENPEILVPTSEQVSDPDKVPDVSVKPKDPLWVIILKILSYIITLILGFVTSSCTGHLF
jgi:hypothetical protein